MATLGGSWEAADDSTPRHSHLRQHRAGAAPSGDALPPSGRFFTLPPPSVSPTLPAQTPKRYSPTLERKRTACQPCSRRRRKRTRNRSGTKDRSQYRILWRAMARQASLSGAHPPKGQAVGHTFATCQSLRYQGQRGEFASAKMRLTPFLFLETTATPSPKGLK
jgi:hypothetical protein